ncbi:MAG TPA: hypothetical protein VD858_03995, partial [Reyranella sp.]|nr:hypothetical protein [Reyranella sp.]
RRTKAPRRASAASLLRQIAGNACPAVPAVGAGLEARQLETTDLLHGGSFGVAFFDGAGGNGMVGEVALEPAVDAIGGDQNVEKI